MLISDSWILVGLNRINFYFENCDCLVGQVTFMTTSL